MPSAPDRSAAATVNRIGELAERVARLEPQLRDARAELHDAIRDAHRHGVERTVIARVAGVSRQRVSQIIEAER